MNSGKYLYSGGTATKKTSSSKKINVSKNAHFI